jgi:putative acetyltransferase
VNKIIIRRAVPQDADQIAELYFNTVTNINKKDYTPKQIEIWAATSLNVDNWKRKVDEQFFFIAEIENEIAGFASVTNDGYIDFMYVHKDHQRKGVASALINKLEEIIQNLNIQEAWAHVSITARPFFRKKGFKVTELYTKSVMGVEFDDAIMRKKY